MNTYATPVPCFTQPETIRHRKLYTLPLADTTYRIRVDGPGSYQIQAPTILATSVNPALWVSAKGPGEDAPPLDVDSEGNPTHWEWEGPRNEGEYGASYGAGDSSIFVRTNTPGTVVLLTLGN